jgi:hypothetical protein
MSRTLQFKRYANTVIANTTGAAGELIIDTTNNILTIHDGVTPGGRSAVSGADTIARTSAQAAFNQANAAFNLANTESSQTFANASFNTANSASLYANSAFIQANASFIRANTPDAIANSSAVYANGAFIAANTADTKAINSGSYANSAFTTANSAAIYANGSFVQANAAFLTANTPQAVANSASLYANGAFTQANAAFLIANTPTAIANSAAIYANGAFIAANTAANTIPQNRQTTNYVLQLSDAGKHIYYTQASNVTLYIPTTSNVAFANGATITIISQTTSSANVTVSPNTGVSMYLAGNITNSSRNVTTYGMATLIQVAANTWFINGTGVS